MNILKEQNGTALTLRLEGRLDTTTSPELERTLAESLPGITELSLDFSGLDYISSAGLRVLLTTQKQMNQQGRMELRHVNETIQEILEVTGFSDILTIV